MKISVNSPCPCGSGKKYKKCCQIYHKGAIVKDALTLMKSRYSAYVVGDVKYIIKTTHKDNPSYQDDIKLWELDIKEFSQNNNFKKLQILSYEESILKAKVEFIVKFEDSKLHELSFFEKVQNQWLYINGIIK